VAELAVETLTDRLDTVEGTVSVWLGPPGRAPAFARLAGSTHYAASTMKLPLLLAAYQQADAGLLDLDETVEVHSAFTSAADGSTYEVSREYDNDEEPWALVGQTASLGWLARRMVVRSSNLATNLVLERVGVEAVAAAWLACGASRSVTVRGIEDYAAERAGMSNLVTAADLAVVLGAIATGVPARAASCAEMLAALADNENLDNVPAGLPPGTYVAHKDGWVEGIAHDAALIRPTDAPPYVLVVCTTAAMSEEAGWALVAEIARASWSDRHSLGQAPPGGQP
jgi:beta-lactamase class A